MKQSGNSPYVPDQVLMSDIAVIMKDLPVSKFRLCQADEHLSEKAIQVAFTGLFSLSIFHLIYPVLTCRSLAFLRDLSWLGRTCRSDASAVEMALQATFSNLLEAVGVPESVVYVLASLLTKKKKHYRFVRLTRT